MGMSLSQLFGHKLTEHGVDAVVCFNFDSCGLYWIIY